jgi:phosphate transport system substrate-binding protein
MYPSSWPANGKSAKLHYCWLWPDDYPPPFFSVYFDLADMGMVARALDPSEAAEFSNLQVLALAQNEAIVIIAHPLVDVDDLNSAEVQGIFSGEITDWSDVGGTGATIRVVASARESDTRVVFEQSVLGQAGFIDNAGIAVEESTGEAVRQAVATQPYAIGFTALKYATASPEIPEDTTEVWPVLDTALLEVKVLALDGIEPSLENINNGTYTLTRPLNIATQKPPNALTQSWLDFIQSAEGQQVVESTDHSQSMPFGDYP